MKKTFMTAIALSVFMFLYMLSCMQASLFPPETSTLVYTVEQTQTLSSFDKGDVNQDNTVNEYDLHFLVRFLFLGGEEPKNLALADLNSDFVVYLSDAIALVNYLITEGIMDAEGATKERGDVNKDGVIDYDDFEFLSNYLVKGGPAPNPLFLGDMNYDLYIDLSDALALANYVMEHTPEENDTTAPVITLLYPDDDDTFKTSDGDKKINFNFEVTDDSALDYCVLVLDNREKTKLDNPTRGVTLTLSRELDADSYDWSIKCVDIYGNTGYSEERSFKIKDTSDDNSDATVRYLGNYLPSQTTTPQFTIPEDDTPITLESDAQQNTTLAWLNTYLIPLILGFLILVSFVVLLILLAQRR